MTRSLNDASIPNYLQILDAMDGVLEKAKAHFAETGVDLEEVVAARLYPDMLPFGFQVQQLAFHSLGAVEAVLSGELNMRERKPPLDYAGLQALVADTAAALRDLHPEPLNAREGAATVFNAPGRQMPFKAEDFIASFSLPNFYFHASMAYAILRSKGVPLGKRDFVGIPRLAS